MAKLFFKYGTMKSGKSTHLLMTRHNYTSQNKKVLVYTSSLDTRWGTGIITSRTGLTAVAHLVTDDIFVDIMEEQQLDDIACILIDEAQFLNYKQITSLCSVVDTLQIPVICYGLKNDFKNALFEGSKTLLELADEIELIKTVCEHPKCGKKAIMNLRLQAGSPIYDGEQIQLGDEEYIPVCRNHYYNFEIDINENK